MSQSVLCGGISENAINDETVQLLGNAAYMIENSMKDHEEITITKCASQVVAGTNYFVKVKIGTSEEYAHFKLHLPLPYQQKPIKVVSHERPKSLEDAFF